VGCTLAEPRPLVYHARALEPFSTIGRELSERWADADCDEQQFPALAVAALEAARLHESIGQREVLRWLASTAHLPRQVPLHFGQPPVNLYRDDRLYIEALFWLHGTTTIHQHAFSGAFCVLEGGSVHTQYVFEETQRLNDQLSLGNLQLAEVELLVPGQVRAIRPGRSFIHALFHLDCPTLSLVVRTHHAPSHPVQYTYHPPGLALDPFFRPEGLTRRLDVLDMLLESGHPELPLYCERFVDTADAIGLTQLLLKLSVHDGGRALVTTMRERAQQRHPALCHALAEVLPQERARALLALRRESVTDPDLRYLLALLLNVTGRERIHALVRARVPQQSALQTLMQWLRTMHDLPSGNGNALGVDLDADGFWVLERMLAGMPEREIIEEATRTARAIRSTRIAQLCFMLPWNSVLGPLLDASADR
jgi:hypothetical protein